MKTELQDNRPIFLQIKETIENDIMTGKLGEDERIPSTNELVAFYNINPVTVMKGVNLLVEEGTVYKKRGIGMFVSPNAKEKLLNMNQSSFFDELIKPLVERSKQLDISKATLVEMIANAWEGGDENAD